MQNIDTQELAQIIATAIVAALNGTEAAAAPKTAPKAKAAPKAGLSPKATKAWNHKFAALLRACPSGSYREAMNRWDEAKAMRDAGKTPAQARTAMGFKVSR